MNKVDVLGIKFDNHSIQTFTDIALNLIQEKRGAYAVTPNTEIVLEAQKDKVLRAAIRKADLVIPDGIGVVMASHILGMPIGGKVAGIDFASALLARLGERHGRVFLLGAAEGVAEAAAEVITERFYGIEVCGTRNGYFDDDQNQAIIDCINAASPDFLMVCLGFPQQEIWMMDNADKLNVGLMAGLGGALDIYSGKKLRAPEKWRDLGLEWLYRLIKEPYRIGRMIRLPLILIKALFKRLGG